MKNGKKQQKTPETDEVRRLKSKQGKPPLDKVRENTIIVSI